MTQAKSTQLLGTNPIGQRSPLWWGMLLLVAIELTVFGGLISIYFYLKLYNPEFPPPGIDKPDLLLPSLNTLVLLAAGASMFFADRAIGKGDGRGLVIWKSLALALAIAFLAIKYVEYSGYHYDWTTHAYGSIVWTITGFHVAHVIAVVLKTIVVLLMAIRGMFTAERRIAVQVNSIYFYFVALIWLPLYFTLYWVPRL